MRLLVTRPEPEALQLKALLAELGIEAVVEPLLRVDFTNSDDIDLSEAQALIVTSRNALPALKAKPELLAIARVLPLFAVGRATAADARALGFEIVVAGAGTVHDLVPQIVSAMDPAAGLLVHLAGDTLAGDLKREVEMHGFRLVQPIVYRTEAVRSLSDDAIEALATGAIDGVILMSPRTAAVYARLIRQHGLARAARSIIHFCLSSAVAAQLAPLGNVRTEIAIAPRLQEVLALVAAAAANSGRQPGLS